MLCLERCCMAVARMRSRSAWSTGSSACGTLGISRGAASRPARTSCLDFLFTTHSLLVAHRSGAPRRSVPLYFLAYLSGTRRSKWRRWRTKTPMYPDIRLFCCFLYICLHSVPPAPRNSRIGVHKPLWGWQTASKLRHKCATVRHSSSLQSLPEAPSARALVWCEAEAFPFFPDSVVAHGTMAIVFAPALVTRVEHVGGHLMRHGDNALLLDELGRYIVGFLELGGGRHNALRELKSATFAQPRKAFEGPVEYAWTFDLDRLFYRWVALSLEGRELHDLDAPKDARRGVRNPWCLVHRPDDLCGWRNLLGVAVLAVHDDRLARNQGVDDVGGS